MVALMWVMIGGALGAGGRYLLGQILLARLAVGGGFPWATLLANIGGALLMGALVGYLSRGASVATGHDSALWLFLGVGLLGGFTTFSTFSLDFWLLIERGHGAQAFAYCAASVVGAILACGISFLAMRLSLP